MNIELLVALQVVGDSSWRFIGGIGQKKSIKESIRLKPDAFFFLIYLVVILFLQLI